jgi:hypothetical protein
VETTQSEIKKTAQLSRSFKKWVVKFYCATRQGQIDRALPIKENCIGYGLYLKHILLAFDRQPKGMGHQQTILIRAAERFFSPVLHYNTSLASAARIAHRTYKRGYIHGMRANGPTDCLAQLNQAVTGPTCRRATARLRAFSLGYRDSFGLAGLSHQKPRSRPVQSYRPYPPTRWGNGFKKCPIGQTSARRLLAIVRRDDEFLSERIHGRSARTKKRRRDCA